MDMAWSDNLSDCEENLLKVSTHVQNTPSSQLHDVYSILLHDRYGHYLLAVFYRTLFHTFLSLGTSFATPMFTRVMPMDWAVVPYMATLALAGIYTVSLTTTLVAAMVVFAVSAMVVVVVVVVAVDMWW